METPLGKINGKLAEQQTIVVDVHEYGSGGYLLSITTGGPIAVQKFVKVR